MRTTFSATVLEKCESRDDIFVITGDAGLGVFDELRDKFPRRFLNMGITEQHTTGFSAGMALAGFKVFIYNIIPFLLYRCYEQVRNDICYQRLPVTLVGIGSGITYAPQGMTHYAVEDIGLAKTLPNLTVFSPVDPFETKAAVEYALDSVLPVYIRLAKSGEPNIHQKPIADVTSPQIISEGKDVAILFHGSIASEVLKAGQILERQSVRPMLVSLPMVQPFNFEKLCLLLKGIRRVVLVEEHFIGTGAGSIIIAEHFRSKPDWELFTLGIPDAFIHEIKDNEHMRDYFGISAKKIAEFVKGMAK